MTNVSQRKRGSHYQAADQPAADQIAAVQPAVDQPAAAERSRRLDPRERPLAALLANFTHGCAGLVRFAWLDHGAAQYVLFLIGSSCILASFVNIPRYEETRRLERERHEAEKQLESLAEESRTIQRQRTALSTDAVYRDTVLRRTLGLRPQGATIEEVRENGNAALGQPPE